VGEILRGGESLIFRIHAETWGQAEATGEQASNWRARGDTTIDAYLGLEIMSVEHLYHWYFNFGIISTLSGVSPAHHTIHITPTEKPPPFLPWTPHESRS
jgi:hypothetical protein